MKIEDTINQFTGVIMLLAKIFPNLEDSFFAKKLQAKISSLTAEYINLHANKEEDSVAQYYLAEKLIREINDILDMLMLFEHLRLVKTTTPLLIASRSLLFLKLEIVRNKNRRTQNPSKVRSSNEQIQRPEPLKNKNTIQNEVTVQSRTKIKQEKRSNPNKEKILEFIKRFPDTRTKDIIYEFNAISDRTVKRNLVELLKEGLVNKKTENKAVYYSSAE